MTETETFTEHQAFEDARHSAGAVAKAAGISKTILQQWCGRELVHFKDVKSGGRTYRKFTAIDAVTVSVMNELREIGINPLESRWISGLARAGIAQRIWFLIDPASTGVATGRFLAVFAKGTPYFCLDNQKISDLHKVGGSGLSACLVLDLDEIIARTLESLQSPAPTVE